MGRPGHPILNWKQIRKAQAVYFFTGATWKKALITETYENSCTVLFQESNASKDYAKRVVDLANLRSVRGYSDE
tara:strand:- start:2246 stop:2467 length:222 start_codon:yes stop_codon:yes gene_type:complete